MDALRDARLIARLVLAWFALSIGVAVASPLIQPSAMELVCSGAGVIKLVVKSTDVGDETGSRAGVHTLDCPLCATASAPPPIAPVVASAACARAYVSRAIPAARIAGLTAAPLPARGPPTLS